MHNQDLPNPNVVLAPAHTGLCILAPLLRNPSFPDLPEFQILITRARSDRRSIGAESTA